MEHLLLKLQFRNSNNQIRKVTNFRRWRCRKSRKITHIQIFFNPFLGDITVVYCRSFQIFYGHRSWNRSLKVFGYGRILRPFFHLCNREHYSLSPYSYTLLESQIYQIKGKSILYMAKSGCEHTKSRSLGLISVSKYYSVYQNW